MQKRFRNFTLLTNYQEVAVVSIYTDCTILASTHILPRFYFSGFIQCISKNIRTIIFKYFKNTFVSLFNISHFISADNVLLSAWHILKKARHYLAKCG